MLKSKLIDTTKCMGCRGCQVACKQWNGLPAEESTFTGHYENPVRYSANTWTRIVFREHENKDTGDVKWLFSKQGCMHCTEAACEKVCPAGAISHTDSGAVTIDRKKCIGCNYCVASCTFNVMAFNQKENVPQKCTLCDDRQHAGLTPACAKACPTGAIKFGDRPELAAYAHHRVSALLSEGKKDAHIYGLNELEGMGVFYILADKPEAYSLPAKPQVSLSAHIWNAVFRPLRVLVVLGIGFALWNNKVESEKIKPD